MVNQFDGCFGAGYGFAKAKREAARKKARSAVVTMFITIFCIGLVSGVDNYYQKQIREARAEAAQAAQMCKKN